MGNSGGYASPADDRASGILLHPTSLPGPGGVGALGSGARAFLDWLAEAGQRLWQVLPLNQTGFGSSPYGAVSSFAGNRLLIDLDDLVELGLLRADELPEAPPVEAHRIDYGRVERWKDGALRRAWAAFPRRAGGELARELEHFASAGEQQGWLPDWTLYAALKRRFEGAWTDWPSELRSRRPGALDAARERERAEIQLETFTQFLFYRQWDRVHAAAGRRGIRILGDVPIYPAPDSADVWAHQELFELDADGRPEACAGVPPDYFSPTGQLWGNPLYRWDRLESDGFRWWIRRLEFLLRHVDLLRLDHFRGFSAFWRVPAGAEDATAGRWVEAPGEALFEAVRRELGPLPLVAEDLGVITPDVVALRRRFGMPGMKVLQFGFDETDSEHLPHRHTPDSVVYTGTHDNDTTRGWYRTLAPAARERLAAYLGAGGDEIHWALIRTAMASVARLAVVPMQDVLGLDSDARMNTPGAESGNWRWRLEDGDLGAAAAARLRRLAELSGRLPVAQDEGEAPAGLESGAAADTGSSSGD